MEPTRDLPRSAAVMPWRWADDSHDCLQDGMARPETAITHELLVVNSQRRKRVRLRKSTGREEELRLVAEEMRVARESVRQTAETERRIAERKRESREGTRREEEDQRAADERQRQYNEEMRVAAEG